MKFFLSYSYREIKRRKCHFCLALCSVFIVVIFTLVINTIVARGPIVFLKMAEGNQGEYDGVITSNEVVIDLETQSDNSRGVYLNYTTIMNKYGKKFNLSPRKNFCGVGFGSDYSNGAIADPYDEEDMKLWR